MLDFDQLKGFYYTAKLRSFTGAAKKLYLTQPAVSLKVKALEDAVGEKLLERVGRKISLTPAGEILYRQAEALVAKLDEIEQIVQNLKTLETGRLALGASDTTSIYFLPELLRAFRNAYPKIDLVIESLFSTDVVRRVIDREVDLGVVALPQEDARLQAEYLFSQRFVCIVSEGHPFCEQNAVKIPDINGEPLILLGDGSLSRRHIDTYLGRAGRAAEVVMELSSFEIIKRYVAAGLGISLIPERAVTEPSAGMRAVPLKQCLSIKVGLIHRRDRLLSHPAKVFLKMARDYFKARTRKGSIRATRGGPDGPSRN